MFTMAIKSDVYSLAVVGHVISNHRQNLTDVELHWLRCDSAPWCRTHRGIGPCQVACSQYRWRHTLRRYLEWRHTLGL